MEQDIQPDSTDPNHYESVLEYVLTEILTTAHAVAVERRVQNGAPWHEQLEWYAKDRQGYRVEPRLAARELLNQRKEQGIIE